MPAGTSQVCVEHDSEAVPVEQVAQPVSRRAAAVFTELGSEIGWVMVVVAGADIRHLAALGPMSTTPHAQASLSQPRSRSYVKLFAASVLGPESVAVGRACRRGGR